MTNPAFQVEEPIKDIDDTLLIPGKWYFWDETWAQANGPYDTEEEANKQLTAYYKWLNGEKP